VTFKYYWDGFLLNRLESCSSEHCSWCWYNRVFIGCHLVFSCNIGRIVFCFSYHYHYRFIIPPAVSLQYYCISGAS